MDILSYKIGYVIHLSNKNKYVQRENDRFVMKKKPCLHLKRLIVYKNFISI